jgi:hypothetical protein
MHLETGQKFGILPFANELDLGGATSLSGQVCCCACFIKKFNLNLKILKENSKLEKKKEKKRFGFP